MLFFVSMTTIYEENCFVGMKGFFSKPEHKRCIGLEKCVWLMLLYTDSKVNVQCVSVFPFLPVFCELRRV